MSSTSTHNFMLADFAGIAVAFGLFSFLNFFPGYTLGWILNVLRFRRRELWFRFAISVPLSMALGPVTSYFVARWLSLRAACWLYLALSAAAIPLIVATRRRVSKAPVAWVILSWSLLSLLTLCNIQIGRRLYFSMMDFDHAIRTAFISSISAFGLPAQNPFFYPGHSVGLRYHYFWLLQSALVHKVGLPWVDARQTLIGGAIWCGIGLISTIALYLRFFGIRADHSSRPLLIGIGLLAVTGLNVVPALLCRVIGVTFPFHREDQVDGWMYSLLWEPHYVASLIACLLAFLLISRVYRSQGQRVISGVIAGLAFVTSVGTAIYIALIFAVFLLIWTVIALFRRWYWEVQMIIVAGVTAVLCSHPFLAELRGPGSGGPFLHLAVRSFFIVELIDKLIAFKYVWQTSLANLILLPLSYFIQLGLYGAVGVFEWHRLRRMQIIPRNDLAFGLMAIASVFVCTFVRSGVISNNDLGWHGTLIAQFVLLIRAAQLWQPKSRNWLLLVLLGTAGTIYDQALVRFYAPLYPAAFLPKLDWLSPDARLGERTYANREAYEWLRAHSPASARIQQNPDPIMQDTFYLLYANRNTLAQDSQCTASFGGDSKECVPLQMILKPLFATAASSDTFDSACAALPMDFLIAKDTDAAWVGEGTWVWTHPPVFANQFVRVFRCASKTSQLQLADPPAHP